MAVKKKLSFEEALGLLEGSEESLKRDGVTLEESLKNFEAGMDYYNQCMEILSEAKQRIEVYTKGGEE